MMLSLSSPTLGLKPPAPPSTPPLRRSLSGFRPLPNPTPAPLRFGLLYGKNQPGLPLKAHQEDGERRSGEAQDGEESYRGESTLPERFRYLAKEAPDPPVRWPWFVALPFLVYAWRAVLFELSRWARPPLAVVSFVVSIVVEFLSSIGGWPQALIGILFSFVEELLGLVGGILNIVGSFVPPTVRSQVWALYTSVARRASVPELTTIIVLASFVLAVGEAAVPSSTRCQPYLLTLSGLIAFAAVKSYIPRLLLWTLLVGVYAFARFVKKRDEVTSALPAAAVLAAVGEPWVRLLAVGSYTALAIFHRSKNIDHKEEAESATTSPYIPLPLLGAALAIGIRLAAKWAENRHLTWISI